MKITPYKGGRSARVYARVTPYVKTALLARVDREGYKSFSDWLEAQAMPHLTKRPPDTAKRPQKPESIAYYRVPKNKKKLANPPCG